MSCNPQEDPNSPEDLSGLEKTRGIELPVNEVVSSYTVALKDQLVPEGHWQSIELVIFIASDFYVDLAENDWLGDVVVDIIENNKEHFIELVEGGAQDVRTYCQFVDGSGKQLSGKESFPSWQSEVGYDVDDTEMPMVSIFVSPFAGMPKFF